jgi:hypothetical protein
MRATVVVCKRYVTLIILSSFYNNITHTHTFALSCVRTEGTVLVMYCTSHERKMKSDVEMICTLRKPVMLKYDELSRTRYVSARTGGYEKRKMS